MDRLSAAVALPKPADAGAAPASSADRRQVAQLAQEFEAMLLLQMVRQMRQSLLDEGEQGEGLGADTMTDTFDLEFARYLAASGGIGLGDLLASHVPGDQTAAATGSSAPGGSTASLLRSDAPVHAAVRDGIGVGDTTSTAAGRTSDLAPGRREVSVAEGAATPAIAVPFDSPVSSPYGWRTDPFLGTSRFHGGMDLKAGYGREVPSAAPGRVIFAGERGAYGQLVEVEHAGGLRTRYAHLSAITVSAGEQLAPGAVVGRVGSSGRSTGPHLHFEVWKDGVRVDPTQMTRAD